MKKIKQKYKDIGLKLLTAIMVFIVAVMPASAWICYSINQYPVPNQLTDNEARDDYHSISADGSIIAFRSNVDGDNEIFVVNSDGSELRQLTNNKRAGGAPSISADGSRIAFHSNVDSDHEIFVINSDGTGLKQLTHNEVHDNNPSISADGSIIAFRSNVDGDNEIFVVNSDGSGLTQLTHNDAREGFPYISADGSKIAFKSKVDGDYEIFVINSDGTGLTQLTDNEAHDSSPAISADGSRIAFHSNVDGDFEIFMINSDGTGLNQLTDNVVTDVDTSICADGSIIAYRSVVGDHSEIIVRMTDKCTEIRFPDIAMKNAPRISADGKKIAFTSNVDGDDEIFVITLTVQALFDVKPDTLNLNSKGKWIITYIEFPESYDVNDIDVNTVILHNQIQAEDNPTEIGDYDNDGIADLMLKFDRYAVQEILEEGDEVEINIKGELFDRTSFEGSDTIRVIDKGKGK